MTDVFISYSRKDQVFCERLTHALELRGRDVWVDFDDIPFGVDWWEAIQFGIEGSEAALFIISPDSIASQVCSLEVNHALKNNKRLIPLMLREVQNDVVPQEISHLNWIHFDKPDEFEDGLARLLETVDTDIEKLRQHTRLLTKAKEWERKGHNPSFLLYGDMLREFEAMSGQPDITELQQDYLNASISGQRHRQMRRRFEWGFIGGMLGVGFWAFSIFSSTSLLTPQRLIYTLSLGEIFGLFVGILSIFAEELPERIHKRIPAALRTITPIMVCLLISILGWAVFGWFYLQLPELTPQGWNAILFGGAGLAAGFILRILVKLPGWLAALLTALFTYIPIYVTFESYWSGANIFEPLIYVSYTNSQQIFTIGIPMVILIALGANAQQLSQEMRALYSRFQPAKAA